MVQATLPKAAWSERATAFTVRTVDGIGRTLRESVKTSFFLDMALYTGTILAPLEAQNQKKTENMERSIKLKCCNVCKK